VELELPGVGQNKKVFKQTVVKHMTLPEARRIKVDVEITSELCGHRQSSGHVNVNTAAPILPPAQLIQDGLINLDVSSSIYSSFSLSMSVA